MCAREAGQRMASGPHLLRIPTHFALARLPLKERASFACGGRITPHNRRSPFPRRTIGAVQTLALGRRMGPGSTTGRPCPTGLPPTTSITGHIIRERVLTLCHPYVGRPHTTRQQSGLHVGHTIELGKIERTLDPQSLREQCWQDEDGGIAPPDVVQWKAGKTMATTQAVETLDTPESLAELRQRIEHLEAENAAMRPIVLRVAEARMYRDAVTMIESCPHCSLKRGGTYGYSGTHDEQCVVSRARALGF